MKMKKVTGTKDLFGRLLYLATTMQIDLPSLFMYPPTSMPFSLAHVNGSMNKTGKSKLMLLLKTKMEYSTVPSSVDVCIIDGMFIIQKLTDVPATYEGISKTLLKLICSMAPIVYFVCDTYISPLIKDAEQSARVECDLDIEIIGAQQKRPKDFHTAL
jgi:hypothetical protein